LAKEKNPLAHIKIRGGGNGFSMRESMEQGLSQGRIARPEEKDDSDEATF